ncbi:hypothetical protein DVK44_08440 [Streptomyces paludis]|uniref:SWIM-type domain-containing protein n=1 Tax=Streptomyces paludis TaxID=2282738 RepID=A0A345HLZ4_9ACTN|nr:hypothetical protein DVK44_08440 [Streptomyces paludis]
MAPEVAAGALELLPTRLRKRVDGAAAKAAGRPVEPFPDGVLVRVTEETTVTLRLTAGIVATEADAVCDCLLAPACLHRAAVLSLAPLAMEPVGGRSGDRSGDPDEKQRPTEESVATEPGATGHGAAGHGAAEPGGAVTGAEPDARVTVALRGLRDAVTAVLVAGVTGTGAVQRAELLHAAHSARLAGLPRPAAAAVRIARRLDEARTGDPAFRLAALSGELAGLLDLVRRPAEALAPARRGYRQSGPLRLYGLFTEPVVTASGYAGATTYALAPDGTLRTVSDIAPGGPGRALQASGTPVPGGCALALRELGDGAGAILTSPAVSADGRIGGGGQVRSVRAAGAGWQDPPLADRWERPPAEQLAAALAWAAEPADTRAVGGDLLFLAGTVTATGFAVTGGPTLRLSAPDERPELPWAENVALLMARPGLALRLIARVLPDRPDRVHALAARWTGHDGEPVRADLGLRRLNRSHIPPVGPPVREAGATDTAGSPTPVSPPEPSSPSSPSSPPALPVELDLLRRTVERAVAGGRAVTAAAADGELPRRLRAVGLTTGARLAEALTEAAADRRHDALGRLLPADPEGFALAWLAAAVYSGAAAESLLLAAWKPAVISSEVN